MRLNAQTRAFQARQVVSNACLCRSTQPRRATACQATSSTKSSKASKKAESLRREEPMDKTYGTPELWSKQTLAMFASGAVVGPLCDNLHSSYDVLHYSNPTITYPIETCWWVPLLFGVAGVILGVGMPILDSLARKFFERSDGSITWLVKPPLAAGGFSPSIAAVVGSIISFVMLYSLSGSLDSQTDPLMGAKLWMLSFCLWAAYDRTVQGLSLAILASIAGPAIEVELVNQFHLYSYMHPGDTGIPLWISSVYFAGSPAVGSLGRLTWRKLRDLPVKAI